MGGLWHCVSHITPHFLCRPCSVYIVPRSLQLWCNHRGEENQSSLTRSGSPCGWEVGWKTCWETAENVGKTWENPRKCWENTGRPKKILWLTMMFRHRMVLIWHLNGDILVYNGIYNEYVMRYDDITDISKKMISG